jgi:transcriptional regulator with XRE-family HTH domain
MGRGRIARLGALRVQRGWTIVGLAARANVSETTVRRLEQGQAGRLRPATVAALTGALGVQPESVAELRAPAARRPPPNSPQAHAQRRRPPLRPVGSSREPAAPPDREGELPLRAERPQ